MPSGLGLLVSAAASAGRLAIPPPSSPATTIPRVVEADEHDVRERLAALRAREKHYRCRDYLSSNTTKDLKSAVAVRAKVVRWMRDAVRAAGFRRNTAAVAVNCLDRFFCSGSSRARKALQRRTEYQLIAMACLYLAIQTQEGVGAACWLSSLSRGLQSPEDIASCARAVAAALKWRVDGPTPFQYVRCLLELLPECAEKSAVISRVERVAAQQVEKALQDYACVVLSPSSIAFATVLNALEDMSQEELPSGHRMEWERVISEAFDAGIESRLIEVVRRRFR